MPRKESKAVPEGNGPITLYVLPGGITLEDISRIMLEVWNRKLDKLTEDLRRTDQRLASLEHIAWQPRPAMKADVQADKKTRERTERSAKAVQAMHGDSFSTNRVDPDSMCSTIFGVKAEPTAFPCTDDGLVENGAAVLMSCLSPLDTRTTTATGGLLPTRETSTATRTTFDHSTLFEGLNSIYLVLQQLLPACCRLLPEGH